MATSANFGNMFSMAGASLFLPFLPLLPKQILLMNLLTDMPEMTISTDNVDAELVEKPRRWDIKFIRKFMIVFGLLSTIFDYTTFVTLLFILHSSSDQFRTSWFMESVISASLVVLVIRTRKSLFKSRPRTHLLFTTLFTVGLTTILPFTPIAGLFGFARISSLYLDCNNNRCLHLYYFSRNSKEDILQKDKFLDQTDNLTCQSSKETIHIFFKHRLME